MSLECVHMFVCFSLHECLVCCAYSPFSLRHENDVYCANAHSVCVFLLFCFANVCFSFFCLAAIVEKYTFIC